MDNILNNFVNSITALKEEALGKVVNIDGKSYSTLPLHPVIPPREPFITEGERFNTLDSLVTFCAFLYEELTGLGAGPSPGNQPGPIPFFLHVVDPTTVEVSGTLKGVARDLYATAEPVSKPLFVSGKRLSQTEWVRSYPYMFAGDEDGKAEDETTRFINHINSVREVKTIEHMDDGYEQRVIAAQSLKQTEKRNLILNWNLKPYRTFPEVEQPTSPFFLAGYSHEDGAYFSLTDVNPGWKLAALESIKKHLQDSMADVGLAHIPVLA